jgi:hypothetical protein
MGSHGRTMLAGGVRAAEDGRAATGRRRRLEARGRLRKDGQPRADYGSWPEEGWAIAGVGVGVASAWVWARSRWLGHRGGRLPPGALAHGGGRAPPRAPEAVAGITEGRWRGGVPPVDGVVEQRWRPHRSGAAARI